MKVKTPAIKDTGTGNKMHGHRAGPKVSEGSYEDALNRTMKAGQVPGVPFASAVGKVASHRGTKIGNLTKRESGGAVSRNK